MKNMCDCHGKCSNPHFGMFILRAVTGFVFISHGLLKFQNIDGVKTFFSMAHIIPWMAPVVAFFEVVGGLALVLGFWTCIFAPILSIIILGAIFMVKWSAGWAGMELEVLLLASTLAIKFNGSGDWKIKGKCGCLMCKKDQ